MAKENLIRARDRALRKLSQIQALIDQGNLSWLTRWRLNHVCGRIQKLDRAILDLVILANIENHEK